MTPKKYPQNLYTQKDIYFSENPPKKMNFKILNPPKNGPSQRMYENIRVPPTPRFGCINICCTAELTHLTPAFVILIVTLWIKLYVSLAALSPCCAQNPSIVG